MQDSPPFETNLANSAPIPIYTTFSFTLALAWA